MKKNLFVIFTFVFSLFALYTTLLVKLPRLRPSSTAVMTDVLRIVSSLDSKQGEEIMQLDYPPYSAKGVNSRVTMWVLRDADPLIPADMIPQEPNITSSDMVRKIALGSSGYQVPHERLKKGVAIALYRNTNPGHEFEHQFTRILGYTEATLVPIERGHVFTECPVVGSTTRQGGDYIASTQDVMVDFDEPMQMLVYEPFRVSSGPFAGKLLAPVVTLDPINVSCIEVTEVRGKLPR